MDRPNFVEKPKNTQLTTWQLGDIVLSNIQLLDINPVDGTSSIMEGLSSWEYNTAMAIRKIINHDAGRAAGYKAECDEQYNLYRGRVADRTAALEGFYPVPGRPDITAYKLNMPLSGRESSISRLAKEVLPRPQQAPTPETM